VLSSSLAIIWSNAAGGTLEDRPRFHTTTCFDPFPFPATTDEQKARIRNLTEQLDAHRKRQQATHPDLTLTEMYNVLEKLRKRKTLTPKERIIHHNGLIGVLRELHDELDIAVLDAYGWIDLLRLLRIAYGNEAPFEPPVPQVEVYATRAAAKIGLDTAILERLVELNAERAAEESRGLVHWLRPEFQNPSAQTTPQQVEMDTGTDTESAGTESMVVAKPLPWPKDAVDQVRAVVDVLAMSQQPLSLDDIAARFTSRGAWKKRLLPLLEMLVALGRAQERRGQYWALK
jgi:hypothetical protein